MTKVFAPVRLGVFGLLALTMLLCACLVPDGGYVGGYTEPYGHEYGGWGPGYRVAPPRGGERRDEHSSARTYRPAPQSRPVPSIPNRSNDRSHDQKHDH